MKPLSLLLAALVALAAPAGLAAAPVPALALTTLDGDAWSLAAQRGRWVVVNFWATWCSPCIREMPEIDAFAAGREDVEVIGLAWQSASPEEIRAFLDAHPVSYPVALLDPFAPPADLDAPRGLPTTWVIDPQGVRVKTFLGPIEVADLERIVGGGTAP